MNGIIPENSSRQKGSTSLKKQSFNQDEMVLYEIFKMLDSDNDGKISATNINLDGIAPEILNCINDLLLALEDELYLNFEDFKELSKHHNVIENLKGS